MSDESIKYVDQACTTYGPWAACGQRKIFLKPARAFLLVESVAKARPRVSNCHSKVFSMGQQNLYIDNK